MNRLTMIVVIMIFASVFLSFIKAIEARKENIKSNVENDIRYKH